MNAISLWQPWASALFVRYEDGQLIKPDETRHWPIPRWVIGQTIAIHAAKRDTRDEREFWDDLPARDRAAFACIGIREYSELPRGCLIGTLRFTACLRTEDAGVEFGSDAYSWGNYSAGRYAWRHANGVLLPAPQPCVGRQGFFTVDLSEVTS